MVTSRAKTVDEYLAELTPERAAVVRTARDTILERLLASVPPERLIEQYEASRA